MLLLGLPIIKSSYTEACEISQSLNYPINSLQCQKMTRCHPLGNMLINMHIIKDAIFYIKATLKDDIYELFCYDNHNIKLLYDIAMISDYKTSVMMNKLFRTIKENGNLDLLEESDDEEEFENTNENKFVNLDTCVKMKCKYIKNFKKWQPYELNNSDQPIITKKELLKYEKY